MQVELDGLKKNTKAVAMSSKEDYCDVIVIVGSRSRMVESC